MADRVLVTGVSGVVGSHVALALLKAGYIVRGSVRSLGKADAVRAMLQVAGGDVSRLEFVALDLESDAGWDAAVRDCRYLQHIASPFQLRAPKDRMDTIRPAVEGTRRAIAAALAASVERIVLTSSAAAVHYGYPADHPALFGEADWSRTEGPDVTAYTESKTRAELEAWSLMEAAGRRDDLAAVNPTIILGPLLSDDIGTSAITIQRMLKGTVFVAPRFYFNIIDVRDVAALHLAAMTAPEAGGHRFIMAADNLSIYDLGQMLKDVFPEYRRRLPQVELPDWLIKSLAFLDADLKANVHSVGVRRLLDSGPAIKLLGRPFITARVAATATARSLIAYGLV